MKNHTSLVISTLFILTTCFSWSQNIVINEMQSSNSTTIADEDGDYSDWIELYNKSSMVVNLNGYGLSDKAGTPLKWIFPNITLNPNTYLLVWASNKNRAVAGSPLHTNFKISASGNAITLADATGNIIDNIPAIELISDISYGRNPNGTGNFAYYNICTPGAANGTSSYASFLKPPTFSSPSGFYAQGFPLTISSLDAGATIYYTLDGSEPDPSNLNGTTYRYKNSYPENPGDPFGTFLYQNYKTYQYTSAISITDRSQSPNKISAISSTYNKTPTYLPSSPVFKGTVVRTKAVKSGALDSPTVSKNYFITPQATNPFTLPIVSLAVTESDFFDYDKGIYVAGVDFDNWRTANPNVVQGATEGIGNYYRLDPASTKKVNLSYLINGTEILNQDVGVQIHGGGSRTYRDKALDVLCKSEFGKNSIDYKLFKDISNSTFKGITLRNSGDDFYQTMFRDALCQELSKNLNCEREAYQPSVLFLNGEYWGIINIREKYSKDYFTEMYNMGPTDIDYIEVPNFAKEGDNIDYNNFTDYLQNNSLASDANYTYINTRMDIKSFSDFFISNIFLSNLDWPGNNVQCWRKRTASYLPNAPYGHDGRWRWTLHDMAQTFVYDSTNLNTNTLALATAPNGPDYPNPAWSTLILRKLLENNNYKISFINRFADLLNTNYLPNQVITTMNSMASAIQPEINNHINRWKTLSGISDWNNLLTRQEDFANKRPDIQRGHILSQFNIDSKINVSLNVSDPTQGYIKINTIDILPITPGVSSTPYPWQGIYFHNIPITVKAIAFPGYAFSYWSGASNSTSAEITLPSSGDMSLTAHFVSASSINAQQIIYFWMMDTNIPNNTSLTNVSSTFEVNPATKATLNFQSCSSIASMQRRDSPTQLNYIQEVNNNLPFLSSNMRGIQVKQPFQNGSLQNTLILNIPTQSYQKIKLDFAIMDEGAATGITIDYSTNAGTPVWTTAGMTTTAFPITTNSYQVIESDFSNISGANNNPNFNVRIQFTGPNLTAINGGQVTFNNISVQGTSIQLSVDQNQTSDFVIYPNPIKDLLNISSNFNDVKYNLFSIDGKLIKNGEFENGVLNLSELHSGLYLIELKSNGATEVKKIIKI